MPLLLKVPGRFDHEQHVDAPVSTMGLGPTLAELCGIENRTPYSEGSLLPIVEDESFAEAHPPITTWQEGNHSVRRGDWRYIRYRTESASSTTIGATPRSTSTSPAMPHFWPPTRRSRRAPPRERLARDVRVRSVCPRGG